jgi:sulfatase maturation enzyme AslB (radical SAM superfamily)
VEPSHVIAPASTASVEQKKKSPPHDPQSLETAFGSPRDFLDNQFVYTSCPPALRGLSVGVNMNPDKNCNFNCVYCEVHRNGEPRQQLDVERMAEELKTTLALVRAERLRERPLVPQSSR